MVHAPRNFEVSCPIFKCGMWRSGNSSQRFTPNVPILQHNVRANLANSMQDLFWHVSFSNEDFETAEDLGRPWRLSRFEIKCSWIKILLRVWDVRREAKRFVSASNLNELKEKGKRRYTFSRGLVSLALPLGLSVS